MLRLTEEQKLICDSALRFIDENCPFDRRQQIAETDAGYDPSTWQEIADLGWLGIAIPDAYGGIGGSLTDTALIQQQLGRALVQCPYLSTASAVTALLLSANEQQKSEHLESVAAGSSIISCALYESGPGPGPDTGDDLPVVETTAVADGNSLVINGCKRLVPWGAQADLLVVSILVEGEVKLLIVPTDSKGIHIRPYRMYDASRTADIEFSDVRVSQDQVLAESDDQVIRQVIDTETALLCMEASALMWAVHNQTLEYMKTREQFGQALGDMQALQHRIVDVYVSCQLGQSMAEDALAAVSEREYRDHQVCRLSAAKAHIGETGRNVGKEGIQLHGGIGMTNDIPIGHYFKRLTAIHRLNGDSSWHRNRFRKLADSCLQPK